MKKEVSKLSQEYQKISQILETKLKALKVFQVAFSTLLVKLDEVINRKDLEECEKSYKELERPFQQLLIEMEQVEQEENIVEDSEEKDETKDQLEEIEDKNQIKRQEVEKKEDIFANISTQYDLLTENSKTLEKSIEKHRSKIQEYLNKIEQIKACEITVYHSKLVNNSLALASKFIRRSIESKILENFVPKKMADFYLAMKLISDTRKIMQSEDQVITRKEVDASYYQDIHQDQLNIKDYQGLIKESLIQIKSLQNEYKNSCHGFPDDSLYSDNVKKMEELENLLLKEALQLEEVIDQYDDTMDYNNQKIKVLKDE